MALKLPTSAGPQFHIAKQTYVYVHASINICDLNSAQRREAPGNPPQLVTCIALLTPFYQSFSFPLRNKETGVSYTVSRVNRSVLNRDIVLFYDSVISFRRFVPPFRDSVVYRLPFNLTLDYSNGTVKLFVIHSLQSKNSSLHICHWPTILSVKFDT